MRTFIQHLLATSAPLALVRVIAATGSAPRGPGAAMLVSGEGHVFGTVGGGTVEHAAIRDAQESLRAGQPQVLDYALKNRDAADLGMVCGGEMRLLCQPVTDRDRAVFRDALARIDAGSPAFLVTDLADFSSHIADARPRDAALFAQPLLTPARTFVFGAGHVAQALVPLLAQCGFRVTVLDDRPDFVSAARFPAAEAVRIVDFSDLGDLAIAREDDVVIMTRGHVHDLAVLTRALRTEARYIGMMGSRSKRAHLSASLREAGFSEADIARVHTPIGLEIAAETPTEIAVSIAAELIAVRAARSGEAR